MKEGIVIKQISQNGIKYLLDIGIIHNTRKGYINKKGQRIGYHKTVNKIYIEDYYVDKFGK